MANTVTKADIAFLDKPGSGETNTPLTSSFDPVALYSDGKVAGLFNNTQSINDGFGLSGVFDKIWRGDWSTESKYQIDRNEAGRPTIVKDNKGNLIFSVSYDEKGAVKEVRFDKGTEVDHAWRPSYLRPGTEADTWNWCDENGQLTVIGYGTFDVDKDANITFKSLSGSETRVEPDGTQEYVGATRKNWAELAKDATVVKNAHGFEVRDKQGKPLRTVVIDISGIVSIAEADGSTWTRNADGKSWDQIWYNTTRGGRAYNLKVDAKGNVSYEETHNLVNEYIDGRVRRGPKSPR